MAEDLNALRQRLKAAVPVHIDTALAEYERFIAGEPPADAKGFAGWHAAAKAALAHVELLVKLGRWAEGGDEGGDGAGGDGGIDRLLAQARAALDSLDDDEDLGGDGA